MASEIMLLACANVFPYEMQPGMEGTDAVYPPSGSGLNRTLNLFIRSV